MKLRRRIANEKNTVGEKLKDYGFCYLKTEGPCRIFMREAYGGNGMGINAIAWTRHISINHKVN